MSRNVKYIRIHEMDNVAVVIEELSVGESIEVGESVVTVQEGIPPGHKMALDTISKGQSVIKYGAPIGLASQDINPGEWVHVHNMKTSLSGVLTYQYQPGVLQNDTGKGTGGTSADKEDRTTYPGYRRSDGRIGVRNDVWIIPTVGCVNGVVSKLAQSAQNAIHGNVSGVHAFPHPYGCSQMGDDQENTRRILGALMTHPNAGGVLVVGLGCENTPIEVLKSHLGEYDASRIRFLACQDVENELQVGMDLLRELIAEAACFVREQVHVSTLVVGLKCGGSDGFSGITANPCVGRFSDRLIAAGGTTILTEVPEMFGAETLLMNRCANETIFQKTVSLINDFKTYYSDHGQTIYENPSPGNKAGGISTLEDKSMGCTQKAGSASVMEVLAYGEPVSVPGLNLLSAPGNDLVAATALAASGAQIVLFTTGRGTPFACPVPTVKISSNSQMATKKKDWIDFDTGPVLDGLSIGEAADRLFEKVLQIASGELVKSEEAGYQDIAIFKQGVTL